MRDSHKGFLDRGWCEIEGPGAFEVHAGEATYVGTLVLETALKAEQPLRVARFMGGLLASEFPERLLDMNLSVVDAKESTLRELDTQGAFAAAEIRVELMEAGRREWSFQAPPLPELPEPPPK